MPSLNPQKHSTASSSLLGVSLPFCLVYSVLGRYLRILSVNPVAHYRYQLPTVYLSVADIENPLICLWLSDLDLCQHHPLL